VNVHRLLVLPLPNLVVVHAAELQQFLLVELQLLALVGGDGKIVLQEDRLLRANLLAHPAVNAPQHVDHKIPRLEFASA